MSSRRDRRLLLLRLDGGTTIEVAPEEARLLVGALWNVAATARDGVVAIGRIEHWLAEGSGPPIELSAPETIALRDAVEAAADPSGELARLRAAIS